MQIQSARGLGGWVLVDSEQPTSDVGSVTFTGLSGYRHIKLVAVFQVSGAAETILVDARVSGGTWREALAQFSCMTDSQHALIAEVSNVNSLDTFKIVDARAVSNSPVALDNTDAIFTASGGTIAPGIGFASYQEVWDEIRLRHEGAAVFEGSTAGQRGYFYVFGMK